MTRFDATGGSPPPPPVVGELLGQLTRTTLDFGMIGIDPQARITEWNRGAERLHGHSHAKIRGQPLAVLYPPERVRKGELDELLEEAVNSGRSEMEGWHLRSDGSRFWGYDVLILVPGDDEGAPLGLGLVVQDLTRRRETRVRRAEKRLRENESRYFQAQKMESLGRLASGVAHDFNNMLTAIMVNAHLLLEELPEGDERRSYSREIEITAAHAASLTHQLLTFSRADAPDPRILDLNELTAAVVTMLRRLIDENIRLDTDLDPELAWVKADPVQLQQVLMNLVLNARDAMPGGGRITISTRNREDREAPAPSPPATQDAGSDPAVGERLPLRAVLAVTDTGVGMDEPTLSQALQPFFTTKEPGKGTGLGLSTVATIVRRSAGDVELESVRGQGTCCRIVLPGFRGSGFTAAEGEEARGARRGTETILLAEDDDVLRSAARRALERDGYEVLDARSGNQALWLVAHRQEPVHLLVTDVRMPVMSGPELARQLRVLRPAVRVLFISGYRREVLAMEGLDSGVAFLSKPFSPQILSAAVRKLLDESPDATTPLQPLEIPQLPV